MISYELYCQIQLYYKERGLSFAQIGRELNLDEETVAEWARQKTYCQHLRSRRKSKLDPYKPIIQRWLEQHPYSAAQIFQLATFYEFEKQLFPMLTRGIGLFLPPLAVPHDPMTISVHVVPLVLHVPCVQVAVDEPL